MNNIDQNFIDDFISAYIEAALWSIVDDNDDPLDNNYDETDIDVKTLEELKKECIDFIEYSTTLLEQADYKNAYSNAEMTGHDFWLTRNRNGAGFWDRGLGELGNKLTEASHCFGSLDLYVGDDGQLYAQ